MDAPKDFPASAHLRHLRVLLLIYLVFVVYGSLVPLKFQYRPLDDAIAAFSVIPFLQLGIGSRADWVANFLLFVPLGFLCAQSFPVGKTRRFRLVSMGGLIGAGFGLALGIEFVQLYFPQRTVSQNDIMAETLGMVAGVLLQTRWGPGFSRFFEAFWSRESRTGRATRALHVYLFALLVFSVLPLDLTISPVELYHKWSQGRVVLLPFSGASGISGWRLYELMTDVLIWVPVGLLWGLESPASVWQLVRRGALVALAIEFAQLFVFSRVTDLTDVVTGACGVGIGALLGRRLALPGISLEGIRSGVWRASWFGWVVLVFAVFWFPYDFSVPIDIGAAAWGALTRAPFTTYYFSTEFRATNELLRRIGFFFPGGFLLGMIVSAILRETGCRKGLASSIWALFGIALSIEIGQFFMSAKFADLTDVFLEVFGGWLGLVFAGWLVSAPVVDASRPGQGEEWAAVGTLTVRNRKPTMSGVWRHMAMILAGVAVVTIVGHLPFVPYNLRELVAIGPWGTISAFGLVSVVYGLAGAPFFSLATCERWGGVVLPATLAAHALLAWMLLRVSVPLEGLYDILGSPVLDWPSELELASRFLALHSAVSLPLIGAGWLFISSRDASKLQYLIWWILWSATLAWPLHSVIVIHAATDNLVELMQDGGSFLASVSLFGAVFFLGLSAVMWSFAVAKPPSRLLALLVGILSMLLSGSLVWAGTEQLIVKYGKVFSALQFLLSADREHYVSGTSLMIRFFVAYVAVSAALAIFQVQALSTSRKVL